MTGGRCVGAALFTDLVGFTEYTDALGDAAALDVLERQRQVADKIVADVCDGRVLKELGDGLMCWFATATAGLTVAVAFLEAVRTGRESGDFPLAVRMGQHHGEALSRGADVVGQTVNIASRVSDLAGPGELLVTEQVAAQCAGALPGVTFRAIGPTVVRGVKEPIWLHRVDVR